jgi:hypothetical protein
MRMSLSGGPRLGACVRKGILRNGGSGGSAAAAWVHNQVSAAQLGDMAVGDTVPMEGIPIG